jgi:hypothetical protein
MRAVVVYGAFDFFLLATSTDLFSALELLMPIIPAPKHDEQVMGRDLVCRYLTLDCYVLNR